MREFSLASFSGNPDGVSDNTGSFAAALKAVKDSGGGVLKVEKGVWRTGPIEVFSRTALFLEEDAVISFIPEPERYAPVWTRWEGVECYAMHPCVFSNEQSDITISGKGVIDGNGLEWWEIYRKKKREKQKEPQTREELALAGLNRGFMNQPSGGGGRSTQFLRPPLIQFRGCKNIRLEGITIRNSPFWTVHPLFSKGIVITGVKVSNPHDAPNTDGIDIDSCEDVLIENCHVTVGDDGIAIKSGAGEDGMKTARPSRRVTVRGCTVENGHGGVVIGSETAAGIFDVLAEDCLFRGTDRGIRIKTRRGRGGQIHGLEFRKLVMENNLCPVAINMFYRCGAALADGFFSQEALPVNEATPSIKNIIITNIRASGCRASAGFIAGLPESPVENLYLRNCDFSTDEQSGVSPDESEMFLGIPQTAEKSIRLLNIKNIECREINVHGPANAFIYE